jgi:hypothetical protein
MAFAKFLAQIIKLMAQFPDYNIKKVRLDNAIEFTSESFINLCTSIGIIVEILYRKIVKGKTKRLLLKLARVHPAETHMFFLFP